MGKNAYELLFFHIYELLFYNNVELHYSKNHTMLDTRSYALHIILQMYFEIKVGAFKNEEDYHISFFCWYFSLQ